MPSIRFLDVADDPRRLEAFLRLPERIYQGDAHYGAPSRAQVRARLFRPEFLSRQKLFVALDQERPVARLVARLSPLPETGVRMGMLCFFECVNQPEVARGIFSLASAWLKSQGAQTLLGPLEGDTWHTYRLNLGPWERPPFLLEPYNPPYYPALWEAYGFKAVERYYSEVVRDLGGAATRLLPLHQRALRQGFTFEALNPKAYNAELNRLYSLSTEIFSENLYYTPISFEAFAQLYAGLRWLLQPGLIWFARAPQGEDAGFFFALPDAFRAVASMRGKQNPWTLLTFFWLRRQARSVNFKTLGVLPRYRKTSVAGALMHLGYAHARQLGYAEANLCLIHEKNISGAFDCGQGMPLRQYALYALTSGRPHA